jgi:hypothetical protein
VLPGMTVVRALEAAGLAESWEAAQALDLAESLDGGGVR